MSARDRIIPDWIYTTDPSGQARPSYAAGIQKNSKPQVIQAAGLAEDSVIPIIYGGPERIAGMPYTMGLDADGTTLLVSFILCEGEIERIASIEVNDAEPPAGCTFTGYYGTQAQLADPWLSGAIAGFTERLEGTAYIVARFPGGSVQGFPRLTAEIYGRRIVDRNQKGVTLGAPVGNTITLADSVGNRINGATALDISIMAALVNWGASGAAQVLVSKATAANPVVSFQFNPAGLLRLLASSTGAAYNIIFDCPVALMPLVAGQLAGLRAVVDLASGGNRTCQFYYSTDGIAWQPLGALVTVAGALAITDATGVPKWQVGGLNNGATAVNAIGTIYSASVKVAGVERVRFNPEAAADGATTWLAPTGEAWTIAGGPVVQTRPAFASTNPAVILDDFMRTFARRPVNAASVKVARDYCNALLGTEARARLTITLAEARDCNEWIEALRGYIPAWVVFKDSEWHIIPDADSAPVFGYNADTDNRTDNDAPMSLFKRGARDAPNIVEVTYTDTTVKPWTDKRVAASLPGLGVGQKRKASLSMPGIRFYGQAYRVAVERLNHFTLESIEGEVAVMDQGIAILPGDIVTITDSAHGWAAKPVRVLRVDERENGRWALRFREYNAGAYSTDAPVVAPPPSSGTLPNPTSVRAITGLTASESLKYENASISTTDALARGLIWQSRIAATWANNPDPFFDFYEVRISGAALAQPIATTSKLAQFLSAPLIQGATYQLEVRVVNSLGFVGAWVGVPVVVNGKVNPPSDVTVVDFAAEIGGEAIFRWRAVPDVDVVRYEWRALATSALTAPWDSLTLLDRPDTTYTRIRGLSPGATLFAVKAIDSVGRYSVNPFYVSLTITSDAANFLQSFDFIPVPGTMTSGYMVESSAPLIEGVVRPLPRWITKGETVWDAAMPNPVASLGAPVVSAFGRTSAWNCVTGVWDFGLVLEAVVKLNLAYWRTLKGIPRLYLTWSTDGVTFGDYTKFWDLAAGAAPFGVVSAAISARYLRLEFYPNAFPDSMMIEGAINAQVSSSTRKESGTATSSASTFTRINLAAKYTKAVSIAITPVGSTFATGSYNNVIVGLSTTPNSFDVYLFNSSGVQLAQAFSWRFEGV